MQDKLGRRQAEQARRQRTRIVPLATGAAQPRGRDEAYHLLVDHSLQGLLIIQDGRVVFANQAAAEVTGFSVDEMLAGTTEQMARFIHPEDLAVVRQRHLDRIAGRPTPARYAFRAIRRDGRVRWLELQADAVEYQGRPALQFALTDVTAHKQTERAMHRSEERFQAMFEQAPALVGVIDGQGRWTHVNQRMAVALGYSPAELTQMQVESVLPPTDGETARTALRELARGVRTVCRLETRYVGKEGRSLWVDLSLSPLHDESGQIEALIAVALDVTAAREAQEQLRQSREAFRDLVENVNDVLIATDCDGRITYISPAVERTFGYLPGELLGQPMWSYIYAEDRPEIEKRFRDRLQGRRSVSEFRIIAKSGDLRWVRTSGLTITEGDRIVGLRGVMVDITERKRMEDALIASERESRLLVETLQEGIWVLDRQARTTYVNQRMAEMLGYTIEEMLGRSVFEFLDQRNVPALAHLLEQRHQGVKARYDFQFLRKDGRSLYAHLEAGPVRDEAGSCIGSIAGVTDITERIAAAEALRVSEERFRRVFEESPVGMVLTSQDLGFFRANPAFCRMLGYTPAEMNSLTFLDVTHPEHREEDRRNVEQLWAGAIPYYRTQKRYLARDGTIRWGSVSASLIQGAVGEPLYALAIIEDITEQKQAQELAKQHQEELAHASRLSTLGVMASGLAHELNQPLSAVLSYASASRRLLEAPDLERARVAQNLDQVVAQAKRAGEIIKRVRAFAQRRPLLLNATDINSIVREALAFLHHELLCRDVEIVSDLREGLPPVWADTVQVEQALLNLMHNALEAMELEGAPRPRRLTVRTSLVASDTIQVAVSDTGLGLKPEMLARIFEPFFTTKSEGLGIGLSITRSIIELHQGRLWARSDPGHGCTFLFTLPAAPPVANSAQTGPTPMT